ncbi:uncharacterized protein cubi_01610 [Cryptosporidium ubiquitum]|uniref:Uncharacterized protein n=1 Tax=Cryptosporidium ubiquitum TaxID=857276 RepID=A0A1J4MHG4_9CRYT|nr:uncharacterized protein cubi_01610 [Cryptosporidium ubiquitum]OII72277.1 hypothetical protein cubi_01610 [Cryptosporidium ubiquitum]
MRKAIFLIFLRLVGGVIRKGEKNHDYSFNTDTLDSNIINNSQQLNEYVNPANIQYCADTSNFEKMRRIPKVNDTELFNQMNLIQVQLITRHGARTPIKSVKCWEGFYQSWNCDDLTTLFQTSAFHKNTETQTLKFSKHYIKEWEKNLNGTCKMGQLILQGYEQHRINGKLLAEAYFKEGENLVTRSRFKIDFNLRDEIYIRSSDLQRTIMSASALITSLLEEIFGKEETFQNIESLPIHTLDILSDYLFSNKNIVDNSRDLRRLFNSKKFQELIGNHTSLYMELYENAKVKNIRSLWPFDLIDCILTSLCTGNYNKLPAAFFKNNLLERTISAVEKEVSAVYNWDNSIISKYDIGRFLLEIVNYILDVILFTEKKNDEFLNISVLCSNTKEMNDNNLQEIPYLLNLLCNKYESYYAINNGEINIKVPKFILFSGHDTTIIPTLASLDIWDGHWPPYASTLIIEVYYNPFIKKESIGDFSTDQSRLESSQSILPYYIRLLYNGVVLTGKLKGCNGNEICHVSNLFLASKFASLNKIKKDLAVNSTKRSDKFSNKSLSHANNSNQKSKKFDVNSSNGIYNKSYSHYFFSFLLGALTSFLVMFLIKKLNLLRSIFKDFDLSTNAQIN